MRHRLALRIVPEADAYSRVLAAVARRGFCAVALEAHGDGMLLVVEGPRPVEPLLRLLRGLACVASAEVAP